MGAARFRRRLGPALFYSAGCVAILALTGCGTVPRAELRRDLTRVLETQAGAWNRGDIDAFMQTYWRSDELSFSSGGSTTRGWTATRDRYRSRYPNAIAMGTLRFEVDEVRALGRDAAMLLGRWFLTRARQGGVSAGSAPVSGEVGTATEVLRGNFTLVFQRLAGGWRIVHDHTSLLTETR